MNTSLHDLELPPEALPMMVWWLIAFAICLFLAGVFWYWRKRQSPVARALRQLERLPDLPPNPIALAAILRIALKNPSPQPRTQPLSASSLRGLGGEGFFKRLDHARFAPTPCSAETFAALKREARTLLEQAR